MKLEIRHLEWKFSQIAFDVQKFKPKSMAGNNKAMVTVDVFSRYTHATAVLGKKSESITNVLINKWTALFGAMKMLLLDWGPRPAESVVKIVANHLGIKQTELYSIHLQVNGTV